MRVNQNSNVFVPFSGFLFFYFTKIMAFKCISQVFVPFSGFLFFYLIAILVGGAWDESSSPSRGFYFSTHHGSRRSLPSTCLRPLLGVSIFLQMKYTGKQPLFGLRPLLGVSIFLQKSQHTNTTF